jgi:hypothetical protein
MGIGALNKPSGQWCPHCQPGKGCAIYSDRPEECRTFSCDWLRIEALGPEWKPEKSKIVMTNRGSKIIAYVDPSAPGQWRKSPFYERLMALMRQGLAEGRLVYVAVSERYTLLLPDREEVLGHLDEKDEVMLRTIRTPVGLSYEVKVSRAEA